MIHLRYHDPESDKTVCGLTPDQVVASWKQFGLIGRGLIGYELTGFPLSSQDVCHGCKTFIYPKRVRFEERDEV